MAILPYLFRGIIFCASKACTFLWVKYTERRQRTAKKLATLLLPSIPDCCMEVQQKRQCFFSLWLKWSGSILLLIEIRGRR